MLDASMDEQIILQESKAGVKLLYANKNKTELILKRQGGEKIKVRLD